MSRRGGVHGPLVLGLAWGLACAGPAAARPAAETLLRRAELVRNPALGIAVDLELSVVDRASGRERRSSRYVLLTRRGDRTLLLMRQDDRTAPGAVLIADDAYWLLLPHAERPVKLPLPYVVAGDLSHAGFLRADLRLRYQPRDAGEETVDGVPCRRLELTPKQEPAPFGRVRYWVAEDGALPIRIEFYGEAGELLKTAHFTRYQETGVGLRPARIEIEDTGRPRERATLSLGAPAGVPTSRLAFDLADLAALRDVARGRAEHGEPPASGKQLVEALEVAARRRASATHPTGWAPRSPPTSQGMK